MADLSITTTQIIPTSDRTKISHGKCGEAITAGQSIYLKASDGKYWKADCDAAASAQCRGIAIASTLAANQEVTLQTGGTITIGAGASITAGVVYVVSGTAGGIAPEGDMTTDDYMCILGVGNGSDGIVMPENGPFYSGVQHA